MRIISLKSALLIGLITCVSAKAQQQNFKLLFHAVGPTSMSGLGGDLNSVGNQNNDLFDDILAICGYPSIDRLYFGSEPMDTIPDLLYYEGHCYTYGEDISLANRLNEDNFSDFEVRQNVDNNLEKIFVYFGNTQPDTLSDLIISHDIPGFDAFGVFTSCNDVNGDSYDDIGTSAVNFFAGSIHQKGKVYIYHGGPNLDTIPDFTITSLPNNFGDLFGSSMSVDGDVNNDGFNDILCQSSYGAYLFLGSSELDSIPDWFIPHYYNGNYIGDPSCIIKDLNGDDYDDIAISWSFGYVLLFWGGENINTTPDLQLYTGYDIVTALASAGDVNHDGFNDIIASNFGAGVVKVFYGGNPMNSSPDLIFHAQGYSAGCAGDVNGDGVDDLFYHEKYYNGGVNGQIFIWGDTTLSAVEKPDITSNPSEFRLHQNYPNPFNSCTGISFYRGVSSEPLSLNIYNIQGQKVYTLEDNSEPNCNVHWVWNGQNHSGTMLPTGVYFLELTDGKTRQVEKMELIR